MPTPVQAEHDAREDRRRAQRLRAAERIAVWRMSTRNSAPRALPPNNSMQLATLRAAADAGRWAKP